MARVGRRQEFAHERVTQMAAAIAAFDLDPATASMAAGFRTIVRDAKASSKIASVADIISAESLRIFEHAQKLALDDDPKIVALGKSFARGEVFPVNAIRAFRKHRNAR